MKPNNNTAQTIFDLPFIGGACLCLLAYCYLATTSNAYGAATLIDLLLVSLPCAGITFLLWWHYYKSDSDPRWWLLLLSAFVFRIVGLFAFPPLEDDFYRYLLDGRNTIELGSPYALAPSQLFEYLRHTDPPYLGIAEHINYPQVPTVYGPTAQWLFALAYWIAPQQIWPLQLLMSLTDMGLIVVLLKLTRARNVLLYAWSPLIIKEFAFTAHPDVLGAALMMTAILLLSNNKNNFAQRAFSAGVLLALAAGVKVFALIVAPFVLRFNHYAWAAFIGCCIVISLPFGIVTAWYPDGLKIMGDSWLFNAPLYYFLEGWVSLNLLKATLAGCFLLLLAVYYIRFITNPSTSVNKVRGEWIFAGLFLITPALNPWYLVWLLPFAVLRPTLWAWVGSVSMLLAYASGINLASFSQYENLALYQHPLWVIQTEFMPILLAIVGSRVYFSIFKR